MFEFLRKRRIRRYIKGAAEYTGKLYIPEEVHTVKICAQKPDYDIGEVRFQSRRSVSSIDSGEVSTSSRKLSGRDTFPRIQFDKQQGIRGRNIGGLIDVLSYGIEKTFVEKVADYIKEKELRDVWVYKAAQIDRRLFSKMMSDHGYKPSKDTAVAVALALKLPLQQANELLASAGYTLTHSCKRDIIIEYFFREKIYNIIDVNLVLDGLGEKPLGR